MESLVYSTERPKIDGYYNVIWNKGQKPELWYIKHIFVDGEEFWLVCDNEEDDGEELEVDIFDPENIQFSQLIVKK